MSTPRLRLVYGGKPHDAKTSFYVGLFQAARSAKRAGKVPPTLEEYRAGLTKAPPVLRVVTPSGRRVLPKKRATRQALCAEPVTGAGIIDFSDIIAEAREEVRALRLSQRQHNDPWPTRECLDELKMAIRVDGLLLRAQREHERRGETFNPDAYVQTAEFRRCCQQCGVSAQHVAREVAYSASQGGAA